MIAASDPCRAIRCIQQSLHFPGIEVLDIALHIAFAWHAQDFLAMKHISWLMNGNKPEERTDGRQSCIAASGSVFSCGFDIVQKKSDQLSIKISNAQLSGHFPHLLTSKFQKQSERIAVTG